MASHHLPLAVLVLLFAVSASSASPDAHQIAPAADFTPVKTFDYYERADTSRACLRLTNVEHCDVVGLLAGIVYDTKVSCCDKDNYHRSGGSFMGMQRSIGKCSWRYDPYLLTFLRLLFTQIPGLQDFIEGLLGITLPIEPITGTTQVGTFSVQCDFTSGSEECSEGLCDDLILQATGPLYLVPNAAVRGQPVVEGDLQCFLNTLLGASLVNTAPREGKSGVASLDPAIMAALLPLNPSANLTDMLTNRAASKEFKNVQAKIAKAQYDSDPSTDGATYYNGMAIVAQAPVEVFNRRTKAKYDSGFMSTTLRYYLDRANTDPITPTDSQYIADPYRFDLVLNKKDDGYNKY